MQSVSAFQMPLEYPAVIFPTRLEWLCQPEQIEQSLRLIYYLNYWKNARQQLLYIDRRGLAVVQELVLAHAIKMHVVQPTAYLDRSARFPGELLLDSVVEEAAREIIVHLNGLNDPLLWPPFCPDGDRMYQRFIRPLYKRITGKHFKFVKDAAEAVDIARLRGYLQERMNRLVAQAKETRQAISTRRLSAMCIAPVHLLPIRDNRRNFLDTYDSWGELDISDLRKLDPEGYSEVALQYTSASAEFVFHLPLRRAELLMPDTRLCELLPAPDTSQERGIYQGKAVDDEESARHPAREILQDLGVEIARVCPRELQDKATFLAGPSASSLRSRVSGDQSSTENDDPWDDLYLPFSMI